MLSYWTLAKHSTRFPTSGYYASWTITESVAKSWIGLHHSWQVVARVLCVRALPLQPSVSSVASHRGQYWDHFFSSFTSTIFLCPVHAKAVCRWLLTVQTYKCKKWLWHLTEWSRSITGMGGYLADVFQSRQMWSPACDTENQKCHTVIILYQ